MALTNCLPAFAYGTSPACYGSSGYFRSKYTLVYCRDPNKTKISLAPVKMNGAEPIWVRDAT